MSPAPQRPRRFYSSRAPRPAFRPRLEAMEDRYAPAVLTWVVPFTNSTHALVVRQTTGNKVEIVDNNVTVASLSLGSVDAVSIVGQNQTENLKVDFTNGFFARPIGFAAAGGDDSIEVVGNLGANTTALYTPNDKTFGAGTAAVTGAVSKTATGTAAISFTGTDSATVRTMVAATLTTPNDIDLVTIDSPAAGQNRVSGASGAVAFTPLTFSGTTSVTLDTGPAGDFVSLGSAGLVAAGLKNFTAATGAGSDVLATFAASFALPVAGGKFTYSAGAGDTDKIMATADVDFTLTDTALTSSGGGAVTLVSVETADLAGGESGNTIDASGFSGPTFQVGNGGNDWLTDGKGNDTLDAGAGDDKLSSVNHGDDKLLGGQGEDTYSVDTGSTVTGVDSGGNSTIDMSPSDQPVVVTVEDTEATVNGGDGMFLFSGVPTTSIGSSGGDTFYDQGGLDYTFVGGDGDDYYAVGLGSVITTVDSSGNDTVDLGGNTEPVTVDLNETDGVLATDSGDDMLVVAGRIENAVGTSGSDTFTGSPTTRVLEGGAADDTYHLDPTASTEVVITPGSTDTVFDTGGFTVLNFAKAGMGVNVDLGLANGVVQKVDAAGNGLAVFGQVEGVIGSAFADNLSGNELSNILFGGGGSDRLAGQGGDDVVVGGDGDDEVLGGGGRDILVGGRGADRIHGGSGEDLLIAGYTVYDLDPVTLDHVYDVTAYLAIQAEWTRTDRGYEDRVHALRGDTPGGLNGNVYLNAAPTLFSPAPTVFDDGAADVLTGAQQLDWFVIDVGDTITDQVQAGEIIDLTTPGP
jgi:Ca2+-binding RTX toxin-like protein